MPVPEEADIIRQAYELYPTGEYTDRCIGDFLNEAGFRTRRDRLWTKDSVFELRSQTFYPQADALWKRSGPRLR